jgi:MoaA/NifB/PqqE/SkfB family radical SAM enzyme
MYKGLIEAVHWEPTDKCNSKCAMCPRYKNGEEIRTLENKEWTFDEFISAWTPNFLSNLKKILACGNFGDPCACRDFSRIFQYVRSVNPNIMLCVNTNGSLRNTDWWYNLGSVMREDQSKGNYCTFSLDGLEDTNHIYRRGTNWSKIMENVKSFIEAGGVAHWDYIVFEHNEHQVEEARNLAIEMGFKNFNIKRTTRWSKYTDGQGQYPVYNKGEIIYYLKQPKQEKFIPNFGDAALFKKKESEKNQSLTLDDFKNIKMSPIYTSRFVDGEHKFIALNELSIACRAQKEVREYTPWNEIFISAGGHVAPCCFLGSEPFQDKSNRMIDENYLELIELNGGLDSINMFKNNILDILNTPLFQNYIPWSWSENKNAAPRKCAECCGVEWNSLDFGELGNKKEGYLNKP